MKHVIAAILIGCLAMPAAAIAPDVSTRPLARGQEPAQVSTRPKLRPEAKALLAVEAALPNRPKLRPASEQEKAIGAGAQVILASTAVGLPQSLHPVTRPKGLAEKVMGQRRKAKRELARGAVCGDPAIQGDAVGAVPGRIRGCGVQNSVKVRSVS